MCFSNVLETKIGKQLEIYMSGKMWYEENTLQ